MHKLTDAGLWIDTDWNDVEMKENINRQLWARKKSRNKKNGDGSKQIVADLS